VNYSVNALSSMHIANRSSYTAYLLRHICCGGGTGWADFCYTGNECNLIWQKCYPNQPSKL